MNAPIVFGEVLFDRFPDGSSVLGGAPFNVAWHLAAFGLDPAFVGRVGDDDAGAEVRRAMKEWNLDTRWLQTDPEHPTGSVVVSLENGSPSFSIEPDQAYDHVSEHAMPDEASLIYHGTLSLRSPETRRAFETLSERTSAPLFLDVNLREPWWEADLVTALIRRASWVKLNDDELDELAPGSGELEKRAADFAKRFELEAAFVTLGADGSLLVTGKGEASRATPEAGGEVVDTVGAGDAFAAVSLLGLARGWPLPETQQRAQRFASAMVGVRGGTCREREFYRPFSTQWAEE